MKSIPIFLIAALYFSAAALHAQDFWTPVPGPYGANVHALAVNNDGALLAGTYGKGVFRSTSNGDSWTPFAGALQELYVSEIAYNLSGHMFVCSYDVGVFRSTDEGTSWAEFNLGLAHPSVEAYAVHSAGYIFAATSGGVFRSADGGESWTPVNNGLINSHMISFTIDLAGRHKERSRFHAGYQWNQLCRRQRHRLSFNR